MGDHHLSLLPFFFLLDLFILPRYVHPHFSSDFEPCANKRSGVLDFCVLHFLCFFFFLLFILWEHLALFGNSSLSKNLKRESHDHFSGVKFFFYFDIYSPSICSFSGHLPTHDAWPAPHMEDVGFGRSFCRISFYCSSSSISKHLFFFCYWM